MDPTSSRAIGPGEKFIVLTALMPAAMSFTILTPILHKLQLDLLPGDHDGLLVRIALSIIGLSMMLGSPLAGWVIDRFGTRIVLIASFSVWIGCGIADFGITDVHWLIATRFLQGFGASGCVIATTSLVGRLPDELARARLLGTSLMLATVAGMLTLAVSGVIGDIGWRNAFLLHLTLVPSLVVALTLPRFTNPARTTVARPDEPLTSMWRQIPAGLVLLGFIAGLVTYSTTTYMPFRFHELGVDSSRLIGLAFTGQTAAVAVFAYLYAPSRRWLSSRGAFMASFAVAGIGAGLLGIVTHYWLVVGGFVVFGAGIAGIMPNLLALASAAKSEYRGRIVGFVKGMNYAAILMGALIFEPVERSGGPARVMLSNCALALAVVLALAARTHMVSSAQDVVASRAGRGDS
jgi:MFS family permease